MRSLAGGVTASVWVGKGESLLVGGKIIVRHTETKYLCFNTAVTQTCSAVGRECVNSQCCVVGSTRL